jgi:hypothetical protein
MLADIKLHTLGQLAEMTWFSNPAFYPAREGLRSPVMALSAALLIKDA